MKVLYGFVFFLFAISYSERSFSEESVREQELKRMEINKKYDKLKLREKTDFVVDSSEKFLIETEGNNAVGDFTVATIAPTVKLQILPDMEPEYFLHLEDSEEAYMLAWANWARITRSEDNRFYFPISNHLGQGCQMNLYEYCPARNIVHKVLDIDELLGWTEHTYTDGKIHGHMRIMPDGTLWGATHFGVYPDSSWWANGYRGSWLFSYNIFSHEKKNWGIPLVDEMLPCFNIDTRRGRFVGTGAHLKVLSWDCYNGKVRFAGYPPNGWEWWRRAMLCDEATGKFWTTENSDGEHHFMSFDPEYNKFEKYDVTTTVNPYKNIKSELRSYTDEPAMDGWYYCGAGKRNGAFFRFKPEGPNGPEVKALGANWDKGCDVLQMVVRPKGRYVYYYPRGGAPLVQYDVKTGRKKALCWLQDYYYEKYGIKLDPGFGMNISKDGSFVVLCMNGAFREPDVGNHEHPNLVVIEIPEKERLE